MLASQPSNSLDKRRVLIVDQSEETREVLRTILNRKGIDTIASAKVNEVVEIARTWHPDVVVLDSESTFADEDAVHEQFAERANRDGGSLVVLGSASRLSTSVPADRLVSKPYHYGPLIRKIEELVDDVVTARRKAS